jgi:hypothetical protein
METINTFCNTLVDKVGRQAYLLLIDDAKLHALAELCLKQIEDERSVPKQLITNPGAFNSAYYQNNTPDLGKVQEELKKTLANQLYIRNLITESEYKKVWPTKST